MLTPAQTIIAQDSHRFRVIDCGRRFGKTVLSAKEIKGRAIYSPSKIAYFATTFQQARDIMWEILKNELKGATVNINEARLEIRVKTVGNQESVITLRGWEAVETARGNSYDLLVLDEVASMRNFWIHWQEVLRPTLTDRKGEAIFISSPKGFNHFYKLYNMELEDQDYKSFHFTTYDNPLIPVEEIEKAKKELTEDRFAQEYLADFRKTEGLVYKEFDRERHIFNDIEIRDVVETIAGIDFGYTNPTAVVTIIRDGENNFWVIDEWYHSGQTEEQVAEYVASLRLNKVYPDPENPSAIKVLRDKGVNVREVIKKKDSVQNGIQRVRELFKANKLKIHKNCVNTILELETYSYPEKADLKNPQENPIKENDHAMDAMRMAIMMQPLQNGNIARQYIPSGLTRQPQTKITGRVTAKTFIPKNINLRDRNGIK
jgi:PBSX family phage terminase large subunit